MIKKIKLFPNYTKEGTKDVVNLLQKKLIEYGYEIVHKDFDLGIAIGGDGSFLQMVRNCNFNEDIYYLGVNTGTLGFAQDIKPTDIDRFLKSLQNNDYNIENIGTLQTDIYNYNNNIKLQSLNEIVIKRKDNKTINLNIYINERLLEKFIGDGILLSTSFGSTAQNLSYSGSIVYNDLHTIQITPIGPINNKCYNTLTRSVIIPENRKVSIIPDNYYDKDLLIMSDGEYIICNGNSKINSSVKRKIKHLRMEDYDYTTKVYEKFVKED